MKRARISTSKSQRLAKGAQWSAGVFDQQTPAPRIAAMVLAGETLFVAGSGGGLAAVSTADGKPDFNGVWVFNEERSDDLRALVEEAVGPEATSGDIKKDIVRIWIRQWLTGVIEDPESAYLTVEQTGKEFKTGLGDEVAIFYFGREASSRGPLGGTLRAQRVVLRKGVRCEACAEIERRERLLARQGTNREPR